MAKEKHRSIEDEARKVSIFYYEIIGCIFILISIISILKLGKFGLIFVTLAKVLFGDWYIVFFLFTTFYGLYSLFMHDKFNYKNTRFIGFIFFYIVILLFSHFTLYEYLIENSESYFSSLIDLYKDFINGTYQGILGGGLIGGILFRVIYYFLGSFGIILFSVFLVILGISLLSNKPVLDISKKIFQKGKNITNIFKRFNHFFKYDISYNQKVNKKYQVKMLDPENSINDEEEQDKRRMLYEIFCNDDVTIDNGIISYHYITYKIAKNGYFDTPNVLKMIKDKFLISAFFYSINNNILYLQLPLSMQYDLQIITIFKKTKNMLPIGFDFQNKIVTIDMKNDIILFSDDNQNYQNFIYYMFIILLLNKTITIDNIFIYDEINSFNDLKTYKEVNDFFDDINKRLETKKNDNIDNIDIVIINYIEEKDSILENKIIYYKDITKKYNFFFVLSCVENNQVSERLYKTFKYKLIFRRTSPILNIINKQIEEELAICKDLDYFEDALFVNDNIKRITTPKPSVNEINRFFK